MRVPVPARVVRQALFVAPRPRQSREPGDKRTEFYYCAPWLASTAKSGLADSICLAKQADIEAVEFSGAGLRLARLRVSVSILGFSYQTSPLVGLRFRGVRALGFKGSGLRCGFRV